MEESKKYKKLYMIVTELSETMDAEQWSIISQIPAQQFLEYQNNILNRLLVKKQLFDKYFKTFYNNHVKLLNWSLLATDKKSSLSSYIFRELVNSGSKYYHDKIKTVFENKFIRMKEIKSYLSNESGNGPLEDGAIKSSKQNLDKSLNMKLYHMHKNKEKENQGDEHQFYIKTFDACNGWKSIFYNYERHMEGLSQKDKYNQQIRQHTKHSKQTKDENKLNLLQFEHSISGRPICQVLPFSQFNSSVKLQDSILKQPIGSRVGKIVLVNHQGKPITYKMRKIKAV